MTILTRFVLPVSILAFVVLTITLVLSGDPMFVTAQSTGSSSSAYTNGLTTDLSVTGSGSTGIMRGDTFRYGFTVRNLGPSIAHNVELSILVPLGYQFVGNASAPGCAWNGSNIVCALGTLSGNNPLGVTVAFKTPVQDLCTETSYQLMAEVVASESDSAQSNNRSNIIDTTIRCGAPKTECADGIDNDADGLKDYPDDTGCQSADGTLEARENMERNAQIEREREEQRIRLRQGGRFMFSSSSSLSSLPTEVSLPAPADIPVSPSPEGAFPVTLRLQEDKQEANPGDSIVYSLIVQNDGDVNHHFADVQFQFSPEQLTILESKGTTVENGVLHWSVDVSPKQRQVLRFSARVSRTVKHGDAVNTSASIAFLPDAPTAVSSVQIISKLPQTGSDGYFLRPIDRTMEGFVKPLRK